MKRNMFLIAPSGAGKSELMRVTREFFAPMGIKVVVADGSNLSGTGYKGTNPAEIFVPFLEDDETSYGILCIDELDKKCIPSYGSSGTDYNREVLSQLLIAIEGGTVFTKAGKPIDTSRILIIAGGSFNHLREEREDVKPLGFGASFMARPDLYDGFSTDELVDASFAEFIGRFSSIVQLKKLKYEDFIILLKRYKRKIEKENGVRITLSKKYMEEAYQEFLESSLGCRVIFTKLWDSALESIHKSKMECRENVKLFVKEKGLVIAS